MNISIQQLLLKMEAQLEEAKASSSEGRIRERVHAIKALCEIILEEENTGVASSRSDYQKMYHPAPVSPTVTMPITPTLQTNQSKKVDTGDGNGDSIFDF